jgi:hypothetical protein
MEYSEKTHALGEELDRISEPYHKVKARLAAHTEAMEQKAEGDIFHVPSFEDILLAARLERRYAALHTDYTAALEAYRESKWAEERANPDYDPVAEFFDGLELDHPDTQIYSYRVGGEDGWQRVK